MSDSPSLEDAFVEAHTAWEQATDSIPLVAAAWANVLVELADDVEAFAAWRLIQLPGLQRRLRQIIEQHAPAIAKARSLADLDHGPREGLPIDGGGIAIKGVTDGGTRKY